MDSRNGVVQYDSDARLLETPFIVNALWAGRALFSGRRLARRCCRDSDQHQSGCYRPPSRGPCSSVKLYAGDADGPFVSVLQDINAIKLGEVLVASDERATVDHRGRRNETVSDRERTTIVQQVGLQASGRARHLASHPTPEQRFDERVGLPQLRLGPEGRTDQQLGCRDGVIPAGSSPATIRSYVSRARSAPERTSIRKEVSRL